MRLILLCKYKNETGAALWAVLLISFIILYIVTSSFIYLLEHRQIIDMRFQQVRATEYVKNGLVYLQDLIANDIEIKKGTITEHYVTGTTEINIIAANDHEIHAKISGFDQKGGIQTYDVVLSTESKQILSFLKTVR